MTREQLCHLGRYATWPNSVSAQHTFSLKTLSIRNSGNGVNLHMEALEERALHSFRLQPKCGLDMWLAHFSSGHVCRCALSGSILCNVLSSNSVPVKSIMHILEISCSMDCMFGDEAHNKSRSQINFIITSVVELCWIGLNVRDVCRSLHLERGLDAKFWYYQHYFNSQHHPRVLRKIIGCLRDRAQNICVGSNKEQEINHLRQVSKTMVVWIGW